jgi:8-oxo-dGTP pyrophosphatase MutT (NUDIX family)
MPTLPATTDPYGGVTFDSDALPPSTDDCVAHVRADLDAYRADAKRLAWLKIPITRSALIPELVALGFEFHHARADFVMLVHRLSPDAFMPTDASHFVGAGAVVINDRNELLVVCERVHANANKKPFYKMPGGLVDTGERLGEAVEREVFEETGVRARFESIVCVRHQHGYRFGKSDFYVVCRLTPLSLAINADPDEIAECLWMPVDDYLASDATHAFNKHIVAAAVRGTGATLTSIDGYTTDARRLEVFTVLSV